MFLVVQFGHDPGNIMIVYKGIQLHIAADAQKSPHRVGDLEIIVVIVAGIQSLMQFVVGDRMKHLSVGPAAVIAVNDLAHEPEIRLQAVAHTSELPHKFMFQNICSVETDTVNIKLGHPETDRIKMIIPHDGVPEIQLHQKIESSPVIIRKMIVIFIISPEINVAVPVPVR